MNYTGEHTIACIVRQAFLRPFYFHLPGFTLSAQLRLIHGPDGGWKRHNLSFKFRIDYVSEFVTPGWQTGDKECQFFITPLAV